MSLIQIYIRICATQMYLQYFLVQFIFVLLPFYNCIKQLTRICDFACRLLVVEEILSDLISSRKYSATYLGIYNPCRYMNINVYSRSVFRCIKFSRNSCQSKRWFNKTHSAWDHIEMDKPTTTEQMPTFQKKKGRIKLENWPLNFYLLFVFVYL